MTTLLALLYLAGFIHADRNTLVCSITTYTSSHDQVDHSTSPIMTWNICIEHMSTYVLANCSMNL